MVTRTGIESPQRLFEACRNIEKTPKLRRFRAIQKTEFFRFFLLFCTNKEQIKNKILSQRAFPAVQKS